MGIGTVVVSGRLQGVPFGRPPVTLPEELNPTDAALLALLELERGSSQHHHEKRFQ
jgi:hypothetical protein